MIGTFEPIVQEARIVAIALQTLNHRLLASMYLVYLVLIHEVAGANASAILQLSGYLMLSGTKSWCIRSVGIAVAERRELNGIDR